MHSLRACWALWAIFLAALLPSCLASPQHSRHHAGLHYRRAKDVNDAEASKTQDIYAAQADTYIDPKKGEKAEDHDKLKAPNGSELTSIRVNWHGNEEIAAYVSEDLNKMTLEHLFIVIHGKMRDGDHYWKTANKIIKYARENDVEGSMREMAVIAPQFFSKKYNSGQYSDNQLAWDDLNAWQPGAQALHPDGTTLTSFDVLDGLIDSHANKVMYPNLKNITVVGHGGGGQLIQRYAAVGEDPPDHIHVRYVHGDASSCAYFTEDRPILDGVETSKSECKYYNTWRYGFDEFPGAGGNIKTPQEYFKQYVTRDVVSLVGYEDTKGGGDTSCMATLQGGRNRRARNLIWYRYINGLARTGVDVSAFPGDFEDLPDWSHLVNGTSRLRLVVVKDASHDMEELFEKDVGRAALFHDFDLDHGWRPADSSSTNKTDKPADGSDDDSGGKGGGKSGDEGGYKSGHKGGHKSDGKGDHKSDGESDDNSSGKSGDKGDHKSDDKSGGKSDSN